MRSEHLANLALANSTRRPSKMERFLSAASGSPAPRNPVRRRHRCRDDRRRHHHEVLTMKIIQHSGCNHVGDAHASSFTRLRGMSEGDE